MENHYELVEESVIENDNFKRKISKCVCKNPPKSVEISRRSAASLILDRADLSQRGYKNTKVTLQNENVKLPSYDNVQDFLKALDVGIIERKFCKCPNDCCFSCKSQAKETLTSFLRNSFWFPKLKFPDTSQQEKLFNALKDLNSDLYGHLNPNMRTIFLRLTGDNFRAAGKIPTEQISYSVLNNDCLLHSPYGQFLSSLWRGSESRLNIEIHVAEHYAEIKQLLLHGISITNEKGETEKFNVLPIMCADLSFVKEVLGKCSSTSLYGCFYCKRDINDWNSDKLVEKGSQTLSECMSLGDEALATLGKHPDHDSSKFKNFQQNHFGQYVSISCIFLRKCYPLRGPYTVWHIKLQHISLYTTLIYAACIENERTSLYKIRFF